MNKGNIKTKPVSIIVCDCGGTIGKHVDLKGLPSGLKAAGAGPFLFERTSRFCEQGSCRRTVLKALKNRPVGLVIAACERERYAAGLAAVFKSKKFNEGLVSAVNLREHCAWVHAGRREATQKAVRLILAAAARVRYQKPIVSRARKMYSKVIVLGGGMSGIQTALKLAALGRQVSLVHRGPQPDGGTAAIMAPFFGYLDNDSRRGAGKMKAALENAVARVLNTKKIKVLSNAEMRSINGSAGNFNVGIANGTGEHNLEAGAIVLAVGSFSAFPFQSAGLKPSARLIDLTGLAAKLTRQEVIPDKIAILLDICGEQTRATNALALGAAELLAKMNKEVKIYCHHVRVAASGLEDLYLRARGAGVVVMRSEKSPVISVAENGVILRGANDITGEPEQFDLAVFADSVPGGAVSDVARKAQIGCGPEGWLQYDNVWLLPGLSTRPGIYVVGAARGNNDFREAMNDASSAAASIHTLLGSGRITVPEDQARVDTDKCVLCLTCVRSCPHSAPAISPVSKDGGLKPQITVWESACRRCGICAALCPAQAIQLPRFTDQESEAELTGHGKVVVFACQNSAWRAATAAGTRRQKYNPATQLIPVPCIGKADSRMILRAFENGASKVILLGCHRESCRYLTGADYAAKRIQCLRTQLKQAGYESENLLVGNLTEFEPDKFIEYVRG